MRLPTSVPCVQRFLVTQFEGIFEIRHVPEGEDEFRSYYVKEHLVHWEALAECLSEAHVLPQTLRPREDEVGCGYMTEIDSDQISDALDAPLKAGRTFLKTPATLLPLFVKISVVASPR
jgi:hypothetical protein